MSRSLALSWQQKVSGIPPSDERAFFARLHRRLPDTTWVAADSPNPIRSDVRAFLARLYRRWLYEPENPSRLDVGAELRSVTHPIVNHAGCGLIPGASPHPEV